MMGDVEIRQGELAKAEQRARQLVARYPKQAVGHSLLGAIAATRHQGGAAVESYRRAHELEPSTDSALRLFHVLAVADVPGALRLADQWLRQNPQDRLVRKAVGDLHARSGQYAAARGAYEAVLKQAPRDVEALNNLASVQLMLKDPAALKTAESALAAQPNNPNIIDTAGWAAFHAGQKDRALQLLRDARLRDPSNPEIRFHLATALADAGRRGEARDELEAALNSGRTFQSAKDAQNLLATLR
jgi:Flp pilus assembly protein TadD